MSFLIELVSTLAFAAADILLGRRSRERRLARKAQRIAEQQEAERQEARHEAEGQAAEGQGARRGAGAHPTPADRLTGERG